MILDDPDDDAVEDSHHSQQDDVEGIVAAHLDVAAGHGKDDAQDWDVEQHCKDEPAFRVGPHSVSEAKHEDGSDEGGDEQAPCHQQVDLMNWRLTEGRSKES